MNEKINTKGRLISKKRAIEICSLWHGGQWSALCQFSSSGKYLPEYQLKYMNEILCEIHSVFQMFERILTTKESKELNSLLRWFAYKGSENGIEVILIKHELYGYYYPAIMKNENDIKIEPIYLPR